MDKKLKLELSKPFSKVYPFDKAVRILRKKEKKRLLICIGDTSALKLIENKINANIVVFDGFSKRKKITQTKIKKILNYCKKNHKIIIKLKNPASTISQKLKIALKACISAKTGAIYVDGEEDLASLVAFCYAPIKTIIVYGQPDEGMVIVNISSKKQKKAIDMLKSFDKHRSF